MAYLIFAAVLPSITRTDTLGLAVPLVTLTRTRTAQRAILTSFPQRYDWPVETATKAVSGTLYDAAGIPVAGATVKLVRQLDDMVITTGTTDGAGHYLFLRDASDPYIYYVIGYTAATSPQIHGVSDRGLVPA